MPNFKFLKPFSMIAAGILVGYFSVQLLTTQKSSPNRFLASATLSKIGSEQLSRSMFDIKIRNEVISETGLGVSTVQVTLEAFQKIPPGLTYHWVLPEGAEVVVEGSISGVISEIDQNQAQEFAIKLKGYAHEKKAHVVFAVKGDINQSLINRDVIVSSRPEDSFEYIVQAYEQKKEVDPAAKKKLGKSSLRGPIDPKDVVF